MLSPTDARLRAGAADSEDGLVLVYAALVLSSILVFVAFTVDFGLVFNRDVQGQGALDNATAGGASEIGRLGAPDGDATDQRVFDVVTELTHRSFETGLTLDEWRARWETCSVAEPPEFTQPMIVGPFDTSVDCLRWDPVEDRLFAAMPLDVVKTTFGQLADVDSITIRQTAIVSLVGEAPANLVVLSQDECRALQIGVPPGGAGAGSNVDFEAASIEDAIGNSSPGNVALDGDAACEGAARHHLNLASEGDPWTATYSVLPSTKPGTTRAYDTPSGNPLTGSCAGAGDDFCGGNGTFSPATYDIETTPITRAPVDHALDCKTGYPTNIPNAVGGDDSVPDCPEDGGPDDPGQLMTDYFAAVGDETDVGIDGGGGTEPTVPAVLDQPFGSTVSFTDLDAADPNNIYYRYTNPADRAGSLSATGTYCDIEFVLFNSAFTTTFSPFGSPQTELLWFDGCTSGVNIRTRVVLQNANVVSDGPINITYTAPAFPQAALLGELEMQFGSPGGFIHLRSGRVTLSGSAGGLITSNVVVTFSEADSSAAGGTDVPTGIVLENGAGNLQLIGHIDGSGALAPLALWAEDRAARSSADSCSVDTSAAASRFDLNQLTAATLNGVIFAPDSCLRFGPSTSVLSGSTLYWPAQIWADRLEFSSRPNVSLRYILDPAEERQISIGGSSATFLSG